MKKLILVLLTILSACPLMLKAQGDIFDSPDNKVYLGARLGLDISCPGDVRMDRLSVDLFDSGAGFDAGVILNVPIWKNLYFEPGLSLYYNTIGMDINSVDDDEINAIKASVRRFGFRIPFQFGYRFDFEPCDVTFFTGPVATIGLIGRTHVSMKYEGTKVSESDSCYGDDGFNRVGLGWKFGAGVNYGPYVFQISGTVGMNDTMKGPSKFHDNNIALTVGYNFGF